ncbi:Hpt domain-containing protein [Actinomadura rudentiformis]|uniref:Hpt domain-containing protein n=1 Tax=Actinomadura rudentiformis TaxID=359158 RepID=A0A6H9Z3R2_9ACTN|nr:Hpt domain-containing protein [Actinomadura rudentiformis]KAB2349077.1 Hpt domain-containing protein [Actinomadura rudentiformis]
MVVLTRRACGEVPDGSQAADETAGSPAGRDRGEAGPLNPVGRRGDPPIDRCVLDSLRRDVGENILKAFIRTYLDLLPRRLAEIELALERGDAADARRVMLDLRSGSAMMGAARLAALMGEMEALVRRGRTADAAGLLGQMRREAVDVAAVVGENEGPREHMGDHSPNL